MVLDIAHYGGREQAFVKHTFLDKYLPALIGKVCPGFKEFVYVDGFAGPWESRSGAKFEDTSFGIALNHMTALRVHNQRRGHDIRMQAFLVEKDARTFEQLQTSIEHFPKIEVTPLNGSMEEHATKIASNISSSAFSFTLIDPKGFPDIRSMIPLLKRENSEALVNFMFDFANRFAGTELIPALGDWLSSLGNNEWREQIKELSGFEREQKLERLAAEALRVTGVYKYSPVISVDKALHNRTLYKLIFLSRHPEGLKVFRDSQAKALDAQAIARSKAKSNKKAEGAAIGDLFADGEDAVPNDRSSVLIRQNQEQALPYLVNALTDAGKSGMLWKDLWPPVLQEYSVTRSWLGRQVNELRKSGSLAAPGWPSERKQIPDDDQLLIKD